MQIVAHNHSGYPRDPEAAANEGPVTRAEIDAVIAEQLAAGMDVVTDGQLRDVDPVARLLEAVGGIRLESGRQCADHDAVCRHGIVHGHVRHRGPIFVEEFVEGDDGGAPQRKAVFTGPYTLARHCSLEGGPYRDRAELAGDLSAVLAAEVAALSAAGARWIQVEEPAILANPEDVRLLRTLLEPLWEARGEARLIVATYGGDAVPVYAQLHSLPADVVAVDCPHSPGVADLVAEAGASQQLGLGLVDGRHAALEDAEHLAAHARRMLRHYVHDTVHLLPSCSLQRLPRSVARQKLETLARVRSLLGVSA